MRKKHFVCWLITKDGKKRFEGRAGTKAAAKKKAQKLAKKHKATGELEEVFKEVVGAEPQTFKGKEP